MTHRTRIKICGITDGDEARAVVELGVDALGFIFAPKSPRCLAPEAAREIVATLPPFVDAVGVFVDAPAGEVREIVRYCGLTVIQLHGSEPPDLCAALPCRVLKALRIGPQSTHADFLPYVGKVAGFLLDTYKKGVAGGTGLAFDWDLLPRLAPPGPWILAGGLTPENVGTAIGKTRPFAVDANSGVEYAPGRKNLAMVRQLVEEVKRVDSGQGTVDG